MKRSCEYVTERKEGAFLSRSLSFKGWLAENGIKQKEIADLLGLGIQSVNNKVNGKTDFTLPQIAKICEAYGISADIFLPKELRNSN